MKFAVILIAASALAACNVQAKHDDGDKNETVRISASDSDGNVSFDVPFMKGEVKLPGSVIHEGDVDIDGVKMYPGSRVNSFHVESTGGVSNVNIGFKAPDPADKVRAYFVDQFRQKGVEAIAAGDSINGKSKDGGTFAIRVQDNGGGSQGTITLQDRDDDKD